MTDHKPTFFAFCIGALSVAILWGIHGATYDPQATHSPTGIQMDHERRSAIVEGSIALDIRSLEVDQRGMAIYTFVAYISDMDSTLLANMNAGTILTK